MLARQVRNPLLALLVVAATASFFVGEGADAVIIGAIVTLSVGLGFVNEYHAELASESLHSQLRHRAVVRRDGRWVAYRHEAPGEVGATVVVGVAQC